MVRGGAPGGGNLEARQCVRSTTNVEEKASLPKLVVSRFLRNVGGSEPSNFSGSHTNLRLHRRSLFSMSSCLLRMTLS